MALARMALRIAQEALPAYSSKFSPQRYTQHQLLTLLVLRQSLKTDYRGLIAMLNDWSDLRRVFTGDRQFGPTSIPLYSAAAFEEVSADVLAFHTSRINAGFNVLVDQTVGSGSPENGVEDSLNTPFFRSLCSA